MKVAVKSLRKVHQGDPRAVELFVQEAQILSTLSHSSIVRFHGLGRFPGGGLFIVMDYVEGTNLQDRLRSGPFELRQAVDVVQQVATAIAHAHEYGVVHADLKPANVLLDEANRTVVTDFGFARIIAADATSNDLLVGGTAGYMAPEVLHHGLPPTIAADVFGLGALLWTLLTGSPPGEAASPNRNDAALALVSPIWRKCLAVNPRERYPTVGELIVELANAAGH